jgi:anti-anti-sigma factor
MNMLARIDPSLIVKAVDPPEGQQSYCLELTGHLAGDSAFQLRRAVEPIFLSPTPPNLKLIMDDVRYMDSTGVGVIVAIIQQMRKRGGKLEIHGLTEAGRQLLSILKVTTLSDCVTVTSQ